MITTPRERGLILDAESVRAILEGRKTQHRVPMKPQPEAYDDLPLVHAARHAAPYIDAYNGGPRWCWWTRDDRQGPGDWLCPFGVPGDRLWVRETWQYWDWSEDGEPLLKYRSDGQKKVRTPSDQHQQFAVDDVWAGLSMPDNVAIDGVARDRRWRSSATMPRWASRITLEVTGVRVERVQDISERDAESEGVVGTQEHRDAVACNPKRPGNARYAYSIRWRNQHDGNPFTWDANPWVWVVDFRVLDGGGA